VREITQVARRVRKHVNEKGKEYGRDALEGEQLELIKVSASIGHDSIRTHPSPPNNGVACDISGQVKTVKLLGSGQVTVVNKRET
jgi:hypothetical protein